jgi:hypothetical protein
VSFVQYVKSSRPGRGIFLAVAAYDGISSPFVSSLFSSQASLPYRLDLAIFSGNCHVDDSRNRLVRDFLETDCDELIFLDVDVTWLDCDLKKLIEHDRDIVAGIYPLKNDDEDYPVLPLLGERWAELDGCVEVAGVPTGFLKIRRKVLEKLYPTVPQHRSKEDAYGRMLIPVLFERTLNGISRRGGDYEFCRKAREAGFRVYVDPSMQLGHVGLKLWQGCLGHFWRKEVAIPEGIEAIRSGKADAATYLEMFNVWGNSWALSPEALFTSSVLARHTKAPILECGSGLSTLCLAAATDQPVYALESSPAWASRVDRLARDNGLNNVRVHLTDVKSHGDFEWYADVPRETYGLVLCDGPPRKTGRGGLFKLLKEEISRAFILIDDIVHIPTRESVDAYCASVGRKLEVFEASRPFGVVQ